MADTRASQSSCLSVDSSTNSSDHDNRDSKLISLKHAANLYVVIPSNDLGRLISAAQFPKGSYTQSYTQSHDKQQYQYPTAEC